jgi:hypothetical protein
MKQLSARFVGLATTFALAASLLSEPLLAQDTAPPPQTPAAQDTTQPPIELPENPGRSSQNTPSAAPATATPQAPQPSGPAAASAVQVSGSAASKPAGAAIAPPKQRQVRSWLIKFGFIAGAGAAIGTVAALSAGSPGRVPGSH